MTLDVLVVGAGLAGCVAARRLADAGRQVLVLDRRDHIAGNAFDEFDRHGVLVHRYGPHIFHANSERVWNYLSRFTTWRPYEHRVLAKVDGKLLPIPINQLTLNWLYGLDLDEKGAADFLAKVREPRSAIRTSEDVVLNAVGRDLCDKFFRGYTRKQWGRDLSELSPAVLSRIPTRTNADDRYFTDTYQAMPAEGYAAMMRRMLDHAGISVELRCDYQHCRDRYSAALAIYTGPLDEFFGCCFDRLPYRSLTFEHAHIASSEWFQPAGVVNYPNEFEFTRITEFKHLTGQSHHGTSIVREFPRAEGDPYYPVPCEESAEMFAKYRSLARSESSVLFLGRLAQYRYINMDQVVGSALAATHRILSASSLSIEPITGESDKATDRTGV